MKFTSSLAIFALINNLSSVECVSLKDDDLFTDDGEVSSTMNSMKAAEKAHNTKFTGLNQDGQADAIKEKSAMTFVGDEFVKNDMRKFEKTFVQLDDYMYPEPRPIGEIMAMIGDFDEIKTSNMISRTAEQDQAILGGSSLNDDEDMSTTLESIKTAEKMSGKKLNQVESTKQNAINTGNSIHNFLEDDHRVYTSELDNALVDKDVVDAKAAVEEKQHQQKQALFQMQQRESHKIERKAQQDVAIHFMDDDFVQTNRSDSESDSESDEE